MLAVKRRSTMQPLNGKGWFCWLFHAVLQCILRTCRRTRSQLPSGTVVLAPQLFPPLLRMPSLLHSLALTRSLSDSGEGLRNAGRGGSSWHTLNAP